MWICIVHNRGTSNALYALVLCKQKRLQLFPKTVSADGRVSQILWRWVPSRRAWHRRKLVWQNNSTGSVVPREVVGWPIWVNRWESLWCVTVDSGEWWWVQTAGCRPFAGDGTAAVCQRRGARAAELAQDARHLLAARQTTNWRLHTSRTCRTPGQFASDARSFYQGG